MSDGNNGLTSKFEVTLINHVEKRLKFAFRDDRTTKENDKCTSEDEDGDSLDSSELRIMAKSGAQEDDEVFRKFHHRISSEPSQILRWDTL